LLHHARADAVLHDTAYNGAAVPEFRGEGDPWMHAGSPRALGKRRANIGRSEEHTSELQSLTNLVCRLLLEKKYIAYARDNPGRITMALDGAGTTREIYGELSMRMARVRLFRVQHRCGSPTITARRDGQLRC